MATVVTKRIVRPRQGAHHTLTWGEVPFGWSALHVAEAARKYRVPVPLLLGVWAKETGMGTNVRTSSAGAVGHFQFLPSTAKGYGYPVTNTPTPVQFIAQANGAAHYLSDLHRQKGSWDAAVRAYSGGGYGESDALNEQKKYPEKSAPALGQKVPGVQSTALFPDSVENAATDALNATLEVPKFLYKLGTAVFSADWWLRVGLIIIGIGALFAGIVFMGREFGTSQVSKFIKSKGK